MQLVDKQHIIDYVSAEFSIADSKTLQNIHQGGLNNTKGRDYENYFQLRRAFEIAALDDCDFDKQILGMQVIGFIDDICHIDGEKQIKHNYQAKNSSGRSADWTNDFSERCRKQRAIDYHCFKVRNTKNYLLVSDQAKAAENLEKIPDDLKKLDTCHYFEYRKTLVELVHNTQLSSHIKKLINSTSHSDIDYAAKLILGVLQANQYKSVADIFSQAQADAYPNPFIKFRPAPKTDSIPLWMQQILTNSSNHLAYRLEYNKLIVTLKQGLAVSVDIESINELPFAQVSKVKSMQDLVGLFMAVSAQDLEKHISSSNNGEVQNDSK